MAAQFSPQEWLDCWKAVEKSIQDSPTGTPRDHVQRVFHSRYTNQAEYDWKFDRFLRAYKYLGKHAESLEKQTAVVSSSYQFTVSPHVLVALYRFFATVSDEEVKDEPSPERMARVAEQQRLGQPTK